jgi:hypothetical protein
MKQQQGWRHRGAWLVLSAVLGLGACATPPSRDYTAYRQSRPRSILVLPPLNNSPDVRATYSLLSSVTQPIAESGYYVFPVALVDQTFKENGLTQPGDMHQAPLPKLREIFGADAVLYLTVEQYGASFRVIDSSVVVTATGQLVDARTGQLLWEGRASASDAENRSNSGGGLVGLVVMAVVRQVASNLGDAGRPVARATSERLLRARNNGLLYGPRSPFYLQEPAGR